MKDSIEGFRLSPQQERLWLVRQDSAAFIAQCRIRIDGELEVERLRACLQGIIAQYDALRTTFYRVPSVRLPIQVVNERAAFDWRVVDLSRGNEADQQTEIEKETAQAFDFTCGPLVRALLLALSSGAHLLVITLPSLIADGISLGVFFRALAGSYDAGEPSSATGPGMKYAQYAEWQNQVVDEEGQELDQELCRKGDVAANSASVLPFEAARPASQPFTVSGYRINFPAELHAQLGAVTEERDASAQQFLLACWASLLWRFTRQPGLLVSVFYDGRIYDELSAAVGLYVKYLPAYFELHDELKFSDLLSQVQKTDADLEDLQDRFSPSRFWRSRVDEAAFAPFAYACEAGEDAIEAGRAIFSLRQKFAYSDQFKLQLSCTIETDGLLAELSYDTGLFARGDVETLAEQFRQIVDSAARRPDEAIASLNLLSERQRRELIKGFNQTQTGYGEQAYLHRRFEAQAAATPDRIAIVGEENEHISYDAVNVRANQLARYLRRLAVAPESIIAILSGRRPSLVISALGVLKAGAAYLPLDPSYPRERLEFMLADSSTSVVLSEARLHLELNFLGIQTIHLDQSLDGLRAESAQNLNSIVEPESLAYLIYTSGSTGQPKGAMITQRGLKNYLAWAADAYRLSEGERSLVHSSVSFDLTVTALYLPLLVGGQVALLPEEATLEDLADALKTGSEYGLLKVTPTHMTALNSLLGGEPAKLRSRELIVGGEALQGETVAAWRTHAPGCRITNEYGPTETVVGSSHFEVPQGDNLTGPVPIGSAVANTQLYILDRHLEPAPINLSGELYIGGDGLARGYCNRAEATAEKFCPNPYSDQPGARLYRTGDEAKRLHNGEIVFLGRMDQMVKIRGYRVEPGEIEAALCQHPAIREAAVISRVDSSGNPRLVGYYVTGDNRSQTHGQEALYQLPNGLEIAHINKNETDLLYQDIFLDESYVQCGLSLSDGAVVLDIGANIGLFTLYVSQKLRDVQIYAFEPVPPIFEKLKTNVELHGVNARIFNYGVSNRSREATITYYPKASAMSGIYADAREEAALTTEFLTNQDAALAEYADDFLEGRFESEIFTSQFKRLSEIIKENGIETVDLLKVDVEKSELDILIGIDDEDWPKIKQIVIEVHDIKGRLNTISEMLRRRGYEVSVLQEDLLKHTNLFNLYAIHKSWNSRAKAARNGNGTSEKKSGSPTLSSAELSRFLARKLPDYMIPTSFVHLDALPLTPNGKLDRPALPAPEPLRHKSNQSLVEPRTQPERELVDIWKQLLRVDEVSIHDNFFELGGDSILSIQVIAKAKQAGLQLVPRQVFQHQTIAELAAVARVATAPTVEQGRITGAVPLTPIQHYFFDLDMPDPHHFNQSVMLEMQREIEADKLREALTHLLAHHDGLRMRYEKAGVSWRQSIGLSTNATLLTEIDLSGVAAGNPRAAIETAAAQMQTGLHLLDGPLLHVGLFNLGSGIPQRLFFVVHHLIIDGVSWRILLEDLATVYQQLGSQPAIKLPPKTTSFKQWATRLVEYARSDAALEELPFWLEQAKRSPAPVLSSEPELDIINTNRNVRIARLVLERDATQALLQEVPRFYYAKLNEVLLTALAAAFWQRQKAQTLRVDVEGHGREAIFDDADVSRTIGWFTTIFPLTVELPTRARNDASFLIDALNGVKEQFRRIPRNGIGYGLLRYLSDSTEITAQLNQIPRAEVCFNYLGRFDYASATAFSYQLAGEATGSSRHPDGRRQYQLEVDCRVLDGQLEMEWLYGEQIHRRDLIEKLIADFKEALDLLIDHCQKADRIEYSPSDFPSVSLDQRRLNLIAGGGQEIDDIYPLAPNQEGILFHTLFTPGSASYCVPLNCKLQGALDVKAFQTAWQQAMARHALLRTSFIWEGVERPLQVVARHAQLPWAELDWRDVPAADQPHRLAALLDDDRRIPFDLTQAPLMRFKMIRLSEDTWHFNWVFHHLLFDGWSLAILLTEVLSSFAAICEGSEYTCESRRPYADYVAWLNRQELQSAEGFWRAMLKGFTTPTDLEHMKTGGDRAAQMKAYLEQGTGFSVEESRTIESVARKQQITLNTLVQGVWGILLHHYSGQETVVFGAIVSGRSAELAGIDGMLGLFINTLPVRMDFAGDLELRDWLADLQTQQAELRHYEYTPLAEIQKWSEVPRGRALFDSILVFENYPIDMTRLRFQKGIEVSQLSFKDPSHYPLTLTVACRERLTIRLTYDSAHFDEGAVRRMLEDFKTVMGAVMTRPNVRLAELKEALQESASKQRQMKASALEARRIETLRGARRKPVRQDIEEESTDGK